MLIPWNDGSGENLTLSVSGNIITITTPANNTGVKRYKNITVKTVHTPPLSQVISVSQEPIVCGDLTLDLSNVWNGDIEYKIENQMYPGVYLTGTNNVAEQKTVIAGQSLQNWSSFTGSRIFMTIYGGGTQIGEIILMGSDINILKGGTGVEVTVFSL